MKNGVPEAERTVQTESLVRPPGGQAPAGAALVVAEPEALAEEPPPSAPQPRATPPAPAEHPATGRYHAHLYALYQSRTDAFGKTLLLLAGGGLALSVTFLEKLAGPAPTRTWILVVAWVLLISTSVATLVSLKASSESFLRAADGYPWEDHRDGEELGGAFAKAVPILNWIAVATLALGLFLIALFALLNLKGVTR